MELKSPIQQVMVITITTIKNPKIKTSILNHPQAITLRRHHLPYFPVRYLVLYHQDHLTVIQVKFRNNVAQHDLISELHQIYLICQLISPTQHNTVITLELNFIRPLEGEPQVKEDA
jgi:hypothetical protein